MGAWLAFASNGGSQNVVGLGWMFDSLASAALDAPSGAGSQANASCRLSTGARRRLLAGARCGPLSAVVSAITIGQPLRVANVRSESRLVHGRLCRSTRSRFCGGSAVVRQEWRPVLPFLGARAACACWQLLPQRGPIAGLGYARADVPPADLSTADRPAGEVIAETRAPDSAPAPGRGRGRGRGQNPTPRIDRCMPVWGAGRATPGTGARLPELWNSIKF